MTTEELRNHEEYRLCMNKIKAYKPGFKFTVNFSVIPKAKANALRIILNDAINASLLESVAIGVAINGEFVDETYRRI